MNTVIKAGDEEVLDLCRRQEDDFFDRKSVRIKPNQIQDVAVAFANAEGGMIIVGIEDANPLKYPNPIDQWQGTVCIRGYVTKLLRQAVWNAVDARTTKVSLEDLGQAFRDIDVSEGGKYAAAANPFDRGFCVALTDELLAVTRMIGTPKLEEAVPPRRRSKQQPKLGEVLSTR